MVPSEGKESTCRNRINKEWCSLGEMTQMAREDKCKVENWMVLIKKKKSTQFKSYMVLINNKLALRKKKVVRIQNFLLNKDLLTNNVRSPKTKQKVLNLKS